MYLLAAQLWLVHSGSMNVSIWGNVKRTGANVLCIWEFNCIWSRWPIYLAISFNATVSQANESRRDRGPMKKLQQHLSFMSRSPQMRGHSTSSPCGLRERSPTSQKRLHWPKVFQQLISVLVTSDMTGNQENGGGDISQLAQSRIQMAGLLDSVEMGAFSQQTAE